MTLNRKMASLTARNGYSMTSFLTSGSASDGKPRSFFLCLQKGDIVVIQPGPKMARAARHVGSRKSLRGYPLLERRDVGYHVRY